MFLFRIIKFHFGIIKKNEKMCVGVFQVVVVSLFSWLALDLQGQTLCPPDSCDCLRRSAEQYAQGNDYVRAIRLYNAAIQCNPVQKQALNASIEELFLQIDSLRLVAETQREKTLDTERQVAKATREATDKAADMHKQQKVAEKQRAEADSLLLIAEEAQTLAVQRRDSADAEARRTQEALARLQVVFGDLTDIFLQQAREFIYQLEYDSAYHRAQEAAYLGVPDRLPSLQRVQMELAYVFYETGEKDLSAYLMDSLGLPGVPDVLNGLKMLDSLLFDTLEKRYYPEMVQVAGGTFTMGSKRGDKDERPVHQVTLSDFELARTEHTWWQYSLYCLAKDIKYPEPPSWGRRGNNPVVNVSWEDAQDYVRWLGTKKLGVYQLPTEAEWEYASRSSQDDMIGDSILKEESWYIVNSGNTTHPVAQKKPNQFGLHDMKGNAMEWCNDWYGRYNRKAQLNPPGPPTGQFHILRGGSYIDRSNDCSSTARHNLPNSRNGNVGFRICRHLH